MSKKERYQQLFNELQESLKQLKQKMNQHQRDFMENPNWSYVADVEYINKQLQLITEFV